MLRLRAGARVVRAVRIVPEALGGSPLSQLAQRGHAAAEWYVQRPHTPAEWRVRAERIGGSVPGSWYEHLKDAFGPSSGAAASRLARVVVKRGIVVTTGHQPGLFGEPVYTWSKAMSALALADLIESETGIPTSAVFWAATDDSDFAEGSYTLLARAGGVERVGIDSSMPEGTRVADIPLPDMHSALERLGAARGQIGRAQRRV